MHTIICDGGQKKGIAYGSYKIFDDNGVLVIHKQLVFDDETSNTAEYLILEAALVHSRNLGFDKVSVLSDSNLMVQQLKGLYDCNALHLRKIRDKILKFVQVSFTEFNIRHVPRNIIKHHLGH